MNHRIRHTLNFAHTKKLNAAEAKGAVRSENWGWIATVAF